MAFKPDPSGGDSHRIVGGTSPWQQGVTFTVTSFLFVQFHNEGEQPDANAPHLPVLVCDLNGQKRQQLLATIAANSGNSNAAKSARAAAQAELDALQPLEEYLFLSMLRRSKPIFGGGLMKPKGDLSQLAESTIQATIAADRTASDGTIMQAIAEACGDQLWITTRTPYQGVSSRNTCIGLEFVDFDKAQ